MKSPSAKSTYAVLIILASFTLSISESHIAAQHLTLTQKITLLTLAISSLLSFNASKRNLTPLTSFITITSIALLMSFLSGSSPSIGLFIISLASMSTGLIFYASNLPENLIKKISTIIIALPLISIAASIMLFPLTGRTPWSVEYTGAYRLTGCLPPAHLAMLCVTAIMMCSFKISEGTQKKGNITLALLFLMLLATGTRGALIAGFIAALPQIKIPRKKKSLLIAFALFIPATLIIGKGFENIVSRNNQQADYEQINLSGRSVAWAFFLEKSKETLYFGKGLGAVTKITTNETQANLSFFVTPHNEYIRFFVDLGAFGLIMLLAGSTALFVALKNRLPNNQKPAFYAIALSFLVYSAVDNTFGTPQFLVPFLFILKYIQIKGRNHRAQEPRGFSISNTSSVQRGGIS